MRRLLEIQNSFLISGSEEAKTLSTVDLYAEYVDEQTAGAAGEEAAWRQDDVLLKYKGLTSTSANTS